VKLIDPEFAIYGPPGLDVGSLLSTYAMAYCFRVLVAGGPTAAEPLLAAIECIWTTYSKALVAAGLSEALVARTGELALGFAGCEVSRTALGLAFERSLRIDDADLKAKAELGALQVGERCIRGRHGKGPEALIAELRKFAASMSGPS